tara:strand:- start:502 stop:777 length:276 start_codon:yes stop_codon:yes gene_type:complete
LKNRIVVLDKNAHWFCKEENAKFAFQDKLGHWWLINKNETGKENTKKEKEKMSCGLPPTFDYKELFLKIFYAMLLGSSIGLNIFFIINEIF